ncbi:MAG: HAMP domain-containing protein [Rickettsiales bacterium]|nr:HAMP domain-containing protein [Rickettsiales bacterium]
MKLQTKFLLSSGVLVSVIMGQVIVSGWAFRNNESRGVFQNQMSVIIQRHMEADMMHDAMRGDVLAAILAKQNGESDNILKAQSDLQDHHENFQSNLSKNQAESLPETINNDFSRAQSALEAYFAASSGVMQALKQGEDYHSSLRLFESKFEKMEVENESITNDITDWSHAEGKQASSNSKKSNYFANILSAAAILISIFFVFSMLRMLFRPLQALTHAMQSLNSEETDAHIQGADRRDEIGEIARTVQEYRVNVKEGRDREQSQQQATERLRLQHREELMDMAANFEHRIKAVVDELADTTSSLKVSGEMMVDMARVTTQRTSTMASAAKQTSGNVQSVAAASEELSLSIQEISYQAQNSSTAVRTALGLTDDVNASSLNLIDAVSKISAIIDLIEDIAGQINLLALNATIESARAGDAGKGFAVVASEVKNLATQTAKATTEITDHIRNLEKVAKGVATQLVTIKESIRGIDEYSTVVATAVEEQGAVTKDISSNMSGAAVSTGEIFDTLAVLQESTDSIATSTETVFSSVKELTQQAEKLSDEVSQFLITVRRES